MFNQHVIDYLEYRHCYYRERGYKAFARGWLLRWLDEISA